MFNHEVTILSNIVTLWLRVIFGTLYALRYTAYDHDDTIHVSYTTVLQHTAT